MCTLGVMDSGLSFDGPVIEFSDIKQVIPGESVQLLPLVRS